MTTVFYAFYPSSNILYNIVTPQSPHLVSGVSGSAAVTLAGIDGGSGLQKWWFLPSYAKLTDTIPQYYNIVIDGGGATATYLGYSTNTTSAIVQLYGKDDGSGHQRWIVSPTASATATTFALQTYVPPAAKQSSSGLLILEYLFLSSTGTGLALDETSSPSSAPQWQIQFCPPLS